ncbi:MAG: hypothetical protein AAGA99_20350 [Actinomycetota bacterium]
MHDPDAPGADRPREWLAVPDPEEERTWLFDVSFLTSAWTCIYGSGCPGIEDEPDVEGMIGCCSHGAYLDVDEDEALVRRAIAAMDPSEWQFHAEAERIGDPLFVDDDGNLRTRVVDGGCIMLNRPEHSSGGGCALHQAAMRRGESIHDWKPGVCWQAPLRREDMHDTAGHVWSTIREWKRRDWGEGGLDFGWWCVEDHGAFVGAEPVYRSCQEDLEALTSPAVYGEMRRLLDERQATTWLPLPTRREAHTA